MLFETLRRSTSAFASARMACSCQASSGALTTLCRPASRDGRGRRPSRCSPNAPDCAPTEAVAGRRFCSSMRIPGDRARPTGMAFLERAMSTAAARPKRAGRLDARMRPLSGLRSKRNRTPVRRALFLKRLEFTAKVPAVVVLDGAHVCTARTEVLYRAILSQQFPSSLNYSFVLRRLGPAELGSAGPTNAPDATIAIGMAVSGCPSRAMLDLRTNCGHVAETAESGYSAVEVADAV